MHEICCQATQHRLARIQAVPLAPAALLLQLTMPELKS